MNYNDFKPHLACDADLDKVKYPVIAMPKIDGVRGLNIGGSIVGRRKKAFKNPYISKCYSKVAYTGMDGELALGNWTDPLLCSRTTGFVNRKTPKDGKPTESDELCWWVFDCLAPSVIDLPYSDRLAHLESLVGYVHPEWYSAECKYQIRVVPSKMVYNLDELLQFEEDCLSMGFEGVILRDPDGLHKSGRSTVKSGAYLRIKRFIDFEGVVVNLVEAMENQNEAKTNELGNTERSTHKENMVPKGMVGTIQLRSLQDVVDANGNVLIAKDQVVDVGPGNMVHSERIRAWESFVAGAPDSLVGKVAKSKFFPKGQKDLPRFPTFVSLRAEEDMSE